MDTELFWIRVKNLMKAHKINQTNFAKHLDIPVSTFYSWLQYNRSVEVGTAYSMAAALGVSVEYLVTGEDGKSAEIRLKQTEERKTASARIRKLVGIIQEETEKL